MAGGTHYERAFEGVLRERGIRYAAVDQSQKALLRGERVKSFDFVLYPQRGRGILVDVKGRKLSRKALARGRFEQTWVTAADVEGLGRWEEVFGDGYLAALVFAYWVVDEPEQDGERDYVFVVAELSGYQRLMRQRSRSWQTVHVPVRAFAGLARPLEAFLARQ